MSPNLNLRFTFLLFDGFSNMVLANALEPLRAVKMQGLAHGVDWSITSIDGEDIQSSSKISIKPDGMFDPKKKNGIIVLVAGYNTRQHVNKHLMRTLREASRSADLTLALDSASWLLASAGLLDDHEATIHWQELNAFQEAFPKISVTNQQNVRAGRFLTCGGASAVFGLMFSLIKDRFGLAIAVNASNVFVMDRTRELESENHPVAPNFVTSPLLASALNAMNQNIEDPLTTHELATQLSTSERTLNRTFRAELNMAPGTYYRLLRLQSARYLALETDLSIEQIALRCGFSTGASLTRSFRSQFGMSISDLRR